MLPRMPMLKADLKVRLYEKGPPEGGPYDDRAV